MAKIRREFFGKIHCKKIIFVSYISLQNVVKRTLYIRVFYNT